MPNVQTSTHIWMNSTILILLLLYTPTISFIVYAFTSVTDISMLASRVAVISQVIKYSNIHQSKIIHHPYSSRMSSSFSKSSAVYSSSSSSSSSTTETFIQTLSKAVSDALGTEQPVELVMSTGGGASGGSGATTFVVEDTISGNKYFVKSTSNTKHHQLMMNGEYNSVLELYNTQTIRVPKPIAVGNYNPGSRTFVILEYLQFASGSKCSQYELGQQLAKLHLHSSNNRNYKYGFHVDNTIGATLQPNIPTKDTWVEFYVEHRLNHMLQLTNNVGMSNTDIEKLRTKVTTMLQQHESIVQPSLVHGDLWGGNKGFCYDTTTSNSNDTDDTTKVIVPCIFDPASYYGDREVDIALTYVFGGFNSDFYKGYNDLYPLPPGHEQRRTIYNLYHILNHDVLFGGGYASQARNMIYEILRM